MEVRAESNKMPINQSAKKRKAAFSLRSPASTPMPTAPSTPTSAPSAEGANLSAALTALKVSLKRDFESFAPPTPAVSPAHGRGMPKRARFDFMDCDVSAKADECVQGASVSASARVSPPTAPVPKTSKALLAVSTRIKFELEKRRRRERERAQRPRRRKQLSYFAIVGAFQRAAHERDLAMQLQPLECVVEASTE